MKNQKNKKHAYIALFIATISLIINFWAWSLISPLASSIGKELQISPLQVSVLVAVPVIIGALGRIPLGVLTDKYGGKKVFLFTTLFMILPVIALAFANSLNSYLAAGVFLGMGGASFAIGVPFVSSWFSYGKKGLAIGIYSMGNAGTALSGFLTPQLADTLGQRNTYLLVACVLLFLSITIAFLARNSPSWSPSKMKFSKQIRATTKISTTWHLSLVYFISFGAFVAFGVYLPVLLKVAYDLSLTDAAARAGGFILLATIARPVGGFLSDKFSGALVVKVSLLLTSILALVVSFQSTLTYSTTASYLMLAFVLGLCNGAVMALIGHMFRPNMVGSATGIVGACGGLGGFLPPIVLGITYQTTSSYSIALLLLSVSASLVYIFIRKRLVVGNR